MARQRPAQRCRPFARRAQRSGEENYVPALWFRWRSTEDARRNRQEIGRLAREDPSIGEYRALELTPRAQPKGGSNRASGRSLKKHPSLEFRTAISPQILRSA